MVHGLAVRSWRNSPDGQHSKYADLSELLPHGSHNLVCCLFYGCHTGVHSEAAFF